MALTLPHIAKREESLASFRFQVEIEALKRISLNKQFNSEDRIWLSSLHITLSPSPR